MDSRIMMTLECRSEGLAERDIESLGVMGWGLAATENSSAVVAVAAVLRVGKKAPAGVGGIYIYIYT